MRRDLILGVAAGVLVVIAAAFAIRVLSNGGGDGAASEDEPCSIGPASLRVPISQETFERGDDRLRRMAEAAAESDYDAVWEAFYPYTHALTHDVDARLRLEGEEALANELCEAVLALEIDIVTPNPDFERLRRGAEEIRRLVDRAQAELGFAP